MRVLVTGSEGFLGKHVVSALEDAGHDAIGLDVRQQTFIPRIKADITGLLSKDLFGVVGLDAVIHMAAIAAPRTCDTDPALAYNVNVNGTHQVLKLAVESGAKKFVFISSAHVYGIPPKQLPTVEYSRLDPQDIYTTTKILGEQLCHLYWLNHSLNYTILRLFNAYGPGQQLGYFIPDMIQKALISGIELGGGETTKDFVYVDDVVRAVLLALETSFVGPINIGTGVQTSLNEVAMMIADQVGSSFEATNMSSGYPTRMMADYDRAKKVLGWEPTVNIEEGLRATVGKGTRSLV